jgi:carnitine-CoA ligase
VGKSQPALTLCDVLDDRAAAAPARTLVATRDTTVSVGEVRDLADRLAAGLHHHGVSPGDHVAVMLPNCLEFAVVTFALARLGAVMVPINTAYRKDLLQHVLRSSDSAHLIVDEPWVGLLDGIDLGAVRSLVVRMDGPGPIGGTARPAVPLSRLIGRAGDPPRPSTGPHATQAIMYTSGTTGPSKGVIVPHALALSCAVDSLSFLDGVGRTIYCPLPMFHAAGLWDGLLAALWGGGRIAVVERFSATRFWDDVRALQAEVAMGVVSMIPILLNQAPRPDDRDHPLKTFYMGKSALDADFFERFGVHPVETYTSTEIGIGTASPYGSWKTGSCGRAHEERFEVRVVDEHDHPRGPGQPGELVFRPKRPWEIFTGYYGFPDATARCFRNLWFHTGDRAVVDDDGYYFFVDRIKDAIRRRGENISAFELQRAINAHPKVLESAAFGVPSELEEEDVAVAVVLRPGEVLAPAEIAAWVETRLPAFMVPRYVEILDELPRASTGKLAKHELRARGDRGITPTTWDRERSASAR